VSRNKSDCNQSKFEKWINEGREQEIGKDYKPLIVTRGILSMEMLFNVKN